MSFTEPIFLFLFLPILLVGYYLIRKELKNCFLLAASILFYAASDFDMLWLLITIIAANYLIALLIEATKGRTILQRASLILMIACNFGILFYYKYLIFAVENVNSLFGVNLTVPNIVLPLGISFITFRSVSYCLDVSWGTCHAERNPLNVALYISFFPQVTMGPITKFHEFQDQIRDRVLSVENMADGAKRIILGLAQKLILANQLGIIVDKIFLMQDSERTVLAAWIGIIGYLLQLYYDFAGYSDIAIGLGNFFGFHTPENFNYPYMAKSAGDFWNRWHMTLGTWLKDYIYVPVFRGCSGKQIPVLKKKITFQYADYIALFAVWTFSGLWHGAAWNFILFGYYYCFFIILERIRDNRAKEKRKRLKIKKQPETKLQSAVAHVSTLVIVIFGQLLFRVDGASHFIPYVGSMFGASGIAANTESRYLLSQCWMILIFGILMATPWLKTIQRFAVQHKKIGRIGRILEPIVYLVILTITLSFVFTDTYQAFIYFQF